MTLSHSFDHLSGKLEQLCTELAANQHRHRTTSDWPSASLAQCGQYDVFRGLSGQPLVDSKLLPAQTSSVGDGGSWDAVTQTEAWIRLAKADLLTTFVITQHLGAVKRILGSEAFPNSDRHSSLSSLVEELLRGDQIASVGISHLTTSRRHLDTPAVKASKVDDGYVLNGIVPWVTGANRVDQIVAGGTLEDGNQILVLLSSDLAGMTLGPGAQMIAMTASCTDSVQLVDVLVTDEFVLSGPRESVLSAANVLPTYDVSEVPKTGSVTKPGGAGGLQTSALAAGLAFATLKYLRDESQRRSNLITIVNQFEVECNELRETLLGLAKDADSSSATDVRAAANSLVSRITTAAMTTAKGAGLMADHPVARYCQQAFFFLVWSCPQSVAEAHLCELAGN